MRKNSVKTLIRTLCAAVALVGAAGVFALENGGTASAAQAHADTLVAPTSYEQYLDLEAPTDVAVCERYTAIADGNRIYVYDKTNEEYRKYEHAYYTENPSSNNITKLQFDAQENLYFLDQHDLFLLESDKLEDLQNSTATTTDFSCSTFLIHGNVVYFTVIKQGSTHLLKAPLVNNVPDEQQQKTIIPSENEKSGLSGVPVLAYWNNELYFTNKSLTTDLYKFNPETQSQLNFTDLEIASFDFDITSMSINNGTLVFTTNAKAFYAYSLPRVDENTLQLKATGNYNATCAFNDHVYTVNGNAVTQYSIEQNAFTDFEICSHSASAHRLYGATDICLSKNKLFIADAGNARVSVYDTQSGAFTGNFPIGLSAQYISSDGETVLLASATKVAVYTTDGEKQALFNDIQGNVVGVASVYGKHYFVTESSYFYALTKDENGVWQLVETKKHFNELQLLTADIYGNLYVTSGKYAYSFTETEFTDPDQNGKEAFSALPAGAEKLAVDHEGNFYALANGNVYKNGDGEYVSFTADPLVYAPDGVNATAFTFGAEENETYVLCDGNYLIGSPRLELPTVKTIAVNGADEEIFSEASAEFTVVETRENALLVAFDLEKLEGAEHFPYLYYERSAEAKTALRLGTAGAYSILAYYDRDISAYRTYLTLTSFVGEAEDGSASFETPKTGYITSAVTLYKFPYLTKLLVAGELPRGCEVQVLGELSIDHDYYQVSYVENGETKTGYIPRSYVSETDGLIPEAQTVVYGAEESNRDALWRLAYILLGLAAIAILTDYLLLRKKH